MTRRLACAVTGCGRSTAAIGRFADSIEFVCARHWARVSLLTRAVHNRHRRQARLFGAPLRPIAANRIWERCKREASRAPFANPIDTPAGTSRRRADRRATARRHLQHTETHHA